MNKSIRKTRFHLWDLLIPYAVLLAMAAGQVQLIIIVCALTSNTVMIVMAAMIYWLVLSACYTSWNHRKIRRKFEEPVLQLADAVTAVSRGDFTVSIAPVHTGQEQDYLDVMITNFNSMVQELKSIETLKTDFFSSVSHEIKTPLSVIANYAELLQYDNLSPEKREAYTTGILHASARLSALIGNILKLDKLEKHSIVPSNSTYNLSRQLSECAILFETQWEKKKIDFDARLDERIMISADEELMELVWNNLISNAIKFTPEGGRITLEAHCKNDRIIVRVQDNGCGMSSETQKHIFDKFYQGNSNHSQEGNGLGLALVWKIISLSAGTIDVSSKEGEGSCFEIELLTGM